MPRTIRIGLVFNYSLAYCRAILRGVKRYAQAKPGWIFAPIEPDARGLRLLQSLRPAGVIAHIYTSRLAGMLTELRLPLVNVCGVLPQSSVPRVGLDDVAIGRVAAAHLLDRGLRHFAFVGHLNHGYSVRRQAGFEQAISQAGFTVTSYLETSTNFVPRGQLWSMEPRLLKWVAALPRPTGILACNDLWGAQITEACRQAGVAVPEHLAILGVDNDDLLCELARPSLSSVAVPAEAVGFCASELLDRVLAGRQPARQPILLPPGIVVTRRSSDILSVNDPDVAEAVQFIRARAYEPLRTRDVLKVVPVSRRSLERRFLKALGRGIGAEIRRSHIELAQNLLVTTDLPMSDVARLSGFGESKHLSVAFRQAAGVPPTTYRRQTSTMTHSRK